jgi:hypothetical protein
MPTKKCDLASDSLEPLIFTIRGQRGGPAAGGLKVCGEGA